MSTVCPQCGGILSGTHALCLECVKRIALQEANELAETETSEANDLLPESAQRKPGANPAGIAGGVAGERWGDYELLETIGRGAMGTVFKAQHVRLNRLVALKVISQGSQASEAQRTRFLREAEAVARLQHPHIVTLYETGEVEGQPYLAMEYLPGKTLAESIAKNPLPPRQAAGCVKRISEAVHYAHEHGVLHRDLKPSNVAFDLNLEPRVMDFGLARLVEQDSEMTLTGMAIGSPSYMAPEQAAGKVHEVSGASDVYALGAILYETLTARPPFQAESSVETMRQVVEKDPVSPRLLNASVPRDLETICLKCLEKEPRRRYRTAHVLAEDLGRFLRDEPIAARPIGAPERLARWCRRKPALACWMGVAGALLLLVVIGSPIAILRVNSARRLAEAAERETQQQLYSALLEQARATVRSSEVGQRVNALDAIRRAAAISNSAALRGVAVTALALPDLRFERKWPTTPDTTLANLDPAFERIALCRGGGAVEIRSVADQRLLVTLPASTNLLAFVGLWSVDGRFFAVGRDHDETASVRDVEVWEVASAKQVLLLRATPWGAMSFHPRLPRILIGQPGAAAIWDLETGQELIRHPLEEKPVALKFAPEGERFVALLPSGQKWKVAIHNATNGAAGASHMFVDRVRELDWHPGGRSLAVPDFSGAVHWMDAQTGETRILGWHKAPAVRTFFSPDGEYLFSSGWDRQLTCWDVEAMQRAFTIGLESYVVQFRADGNQCAVFTWPDVSSQLYTIERPVLRREFAGDLGAGRNHAAFSPDGRWLAASGSQRLVVWDLEGEGSSVVLDQAAETRVRFAANGELFADRREACFRWRMKAGTNGAAPTLERLELGKPAGFVSLCLASNGVVFTSDQGSKLAGFDQLAGDQGNWEPTVDGLGGVSPDGQWLGMFRSFTPHFYVYRLPGFEPTAQFTNEASIGQFEFSPRGDELAVACRRGVEFWSTTTWKRTRHLRNFTAILYSPDTRTFWLSTQFRSAGLYDAQTAKPLLLLPAGTIPLTLSPDGSHLAVSVNQRRVQVWDLVELRSRLREVGLDWADNASEPPAARQ